MTDNNEKDDYEILVDHCVDSYKELLNTSMALDINCVQGKMRTIILHDERFIKETKAIKARQYLDEIRQVNGIYDAATKMGGALDASDDYDERDGGGMSDKQIINARKEALSMQLKAAEMRRELKSLNAENSEGEEESAVNFYFTALSREEMMKIKQVEFNEGTADEKSAMKELKKQAEDDIATKTLKRKAAARAMHGDVEDEVEEDFDPDKPLRFED